MSIQKLACPFRQRAILCRRQRPRVHTGAPVPACLGERRPRGASVGHTPVECPAEGDHWHGAGKGRSCYYEALSAKSGIPLGLQAPAVEVPQDDGDRFRSLEGPRRTREPPRGCGHTTTKPGA